MKFFEYLKEAKDNVKASEKYVDGEWGTIPTLEEVKLADIAKSNKIKDYTVVDDKINPWLFKDESKRSVMIKAIVENTPKLVIADSRPITMLAVSLYKTFKGDDATKTKKITDKIIAILSGQGGKYNKPLKTELRLAQTIAGGSNTKNLIIRPNSIIVYLEDKLGGKIVENNIFKTLSSLVAYIVDRYEFTAKEIGFIASEEETDEDWAKVKELEKKVVIHCNSKIVAPVGSTVIGNFGGSIEKVIGYSDATSEHADVKIGLVGAISGKKFLISVTPSKKNLNAIFKTFVPEGLNDKRSSVSELVQKRVDAFFAEAKPKIKDMFDAKPELKKAYGTFEKFWPAYVSSYQRKDEYKKKIAGYEEEAQIEFDSLDDGMIRKYLAQKFGGKVSMLDKRGDFAATLEDMKEIPKNLYELNSELKAKVKTFIFDCMIKDYKLTISKTDFSLPLFPAEVEAQFFNVFTSENQLKDITITTNMELVTADNVKGIGFDKVESGDFSDVKDIVDGSNIKAFNDIVAKFSSESPVDTRFTIQKSGNDIKISAIKGATITLAKSGIPQLNITAEYTDKDYPQNKKILTTSIEGDRDGFLLISKLLKNGKDVITKLASAKETLEAEKNISKKFITTNVELASKNLVVDEVGRQLGEKKEYGIIPRSAYSLDKPKKIINTNGEEETIRKTLDWQGIKNNSLSSIKQKYDGISKVKITAIR